MRFRQTANRGQFWASTGSENEKSAAQNEILPSFLKDSNLRNLRQSCSTPSREDSSTTTSRPE
jgi:hypothetical protein